MVSSSRSLHLPANLQISRPYEGLRPSQWNFFGKNDGNFQKILIKLGAGGMMHPNRISQAIHEIGAHCNQGFCSDMVPVGVSLPRRGYACYVNGSTPVYIDQPGYSKLGSYNCCQACASYGSCDRFVCDGEHYSSERDENLQGALVCNALASGRFIDYSQKIQSDHTSLVELSQKPLGWLSLGVCGNAMIMRAGTHGRCFHQPGLACERVDFTEQITSPRRLYAPVYNKTFATALSQSKSKVIDTETFSVPQGTAITTKNPVRRLKQRKKGKMVASASTRDLFERRSFHLFEVIFCYPFMNANVVASNFQRMSQESLREVIHLVNQVASGLAGIGTTLSLFVVCQMLAFHGSLEKNKVISLVVGIGFVSLSIALTRVADVVKHMAKAYGQGRGPKKEHLINLQKELHGVARNAFPLLVMCLVGVF